MMFRSIKNLALLGAVGATLAIPAFAADGDLDPRGAWKNGNDVLEFTGSNTSRGRYTVEVDYMGMRVSSRGRWTQPSPGIMLWKLTDINIGGKPGNFPMLPSAGDYMFGIFKPGEADTMKLFYEMKGYSDKGASHYPSAKSVDSAPDYKAK
jgi:hypothetical protein